jgi:hypothetical protein
MANSTEEFWSVDGVSLHQYGWAVTTVGGSRYDLPPRRGSNMPIAYRPGQVHRNKLPDARVITLVMFMVGADPGTGPAIGSSLTLADERVQWNDNWDFLRRLVYKNYLSSNRVTLTRRWRLTAPTFPTSRTGDNVIAGDPGTPASGADRILTASTYAEMTANMAPTMTGRTRSDFQLDFTMADPFFYGNTVEVTLSPGQTAYVWNDGHDVAAHAGLTVDFNGPVVNPTLTNLSTSPDSSVTYKSNMLNGYTVSLNVGRYSATAHPTGRTTPVGNRIAYVTNSGARMWFNLLPGANKIQYTTSSGSGTCVLRFQPPYV